MHYYLSSSIIINVKNVLIIILKKITACRLLKWSWKFFNYEIHTLPNILKQNKIYTLIKLI